MSSQTENSTEKALEVVNERNQVAVYSVNITQSFAEPAEKPVAAPEKRVEEKPVAARRGFSGRVFKWRNAIAAAAIAVIGVLHFTFQLSFQNEVSENRKPIAPPPVNEPATIEPLREIELDRPTATASGAEKPAVAAPRRSVQPAKIRRQEAAAPAPSAPARPVLARPVIRKKDLVETKAERLRRAERLLTGV